MSEQIQRETPPMSDMVFPKCNCLLPSPCCHDIMALQATCQALEAERDRETELRREAERHNAELRTALMQKPYLDEVESLEASLSALQAQYAELAAERDQWRTVAGDFHNALVGHGMAGAFNQRLCRQAVRLFDVLNAKHGIGHPEDVAEIREQIRGAEAQLSALLAVLAEIEQEMRDEDWSQHTLQPAGVEIVVNAWADRLRGIRQTEDRTAEKTEKP